MACGASRWLLIGNSRWHWAEGHGSARRYWSEAPQDCLATAPERWAAVGPLPAGLDPTRRLELGQVPRLAAPAWLGIDRALAGHGAWCRSGAPVLVADAGTVLSLTWLDAEGRFRGGRLLAGAALQLRAMHEATAALPAARSWPSLDADAEAWPQPTEAAMVRGVLEGLAGALQRSAAQLRLRQPQLHCWLTGGDAPSLHRLLNPGPLADSTPAWHWAEGLCLDTLAALS